MPFSPGRADVAAKAAEDRRVITREQASAAADQLTAAAELSRNRKVLSRLVRRAGKPPPGMTVECFRERVEEAERQVRTSWVLLCAYGASLLVLVALYYAHATAAFVGAMPVLVLSQVAVRRKLVASRIRRAVADAA
jgi:hypothetical protein